MLSFNYRLFVNDVLDNSDFFVEVQDGIGLNHLATVLRGGYPVCGNAAPAAAKDLSWSLARFDLSASEGEGVRIVFTNRNLWPAAKGLWNFADNVRAVNAPGLQTMFLPLISRPACGTSANMLGVDDLPVP